MATIGLAAVAILISLIFTPVGAIALFVRSMPGILVGIACLYAVGVPGASRRDGLIMRHRFLAPIWGTLSFSLAVTAGCVVSTFWFSGVAFDYRSYLARPLYWLLLYGSIPSALIGFSYLMFGDHVQAGSESR